MSNFLPIPLAIFQTEYCLDSQQISKLNMTLKNKDSLKNQNNLTIEDYFKKQNLKSEDDYKNDNIDQLIRLIPLWYQPSVTRWHSLTTCNTAKANTHPEQSHGLYERVGKV